MGYNTKQNSDGSSDFISDDGITVAGSLKSDGSAVFRGLASANKSVFFDDFLAAGIDSRISSTAGSGTANQAATTVASGVNGEITLTSASDDGAHSANGTSLSLDQTNYKANQGGLMLEARVKLANVTNVALFIGFSDTISTTVELPIYKSGTNDVIAADAANACGVAFDTDGTTDEWFIGGAKATAVTLATHAGSAPTAATYATVRVEVDSSGGVTGYIDGVKIGSVANAVTATTALTPYIVVANRSAAQDVATLDYVLVEQNR